MKTYHVKTGTIVEEWLQDHVNLQTDEVVETEAMRIEIYQDSIEELENQLTDES